MSQRLVRGPNPPAHWYARQYHNRHVRQAAALIVAVAVAVPIALMPIAAQEEDAGSLGPPALYDELREATPEPAGRIPADARLQVDRFEFSFDGGDLYVVPPIGGRDTIAVYLGRGTLRAHPPDGVELQQLRKLIEADTIEEPFDRFVVWFTGDLGARLRALADPDAPGRDARRAADLLDDRRESLLEHRLFNPDARVAMELWRAAADPPLPDAPRGFVFAEIDGREHDWITVELEPWYQEEVGVLRHNRGRRLTEVWLGAHALDDFDPATVAPTVGRFPRDPEALGPVDPEESLDRDDDDEWTARDYGLSPRLLHPDREGWEPRVSVSRTDADLAIEGNGDVVASVALVVEPLVDLAAFRIRVSSLAEIIDVRWRPDVPAGIDDILEIPLFDHAASGDPEEPPPLTGQPIHWVQEDDPRMMEDDRYDPRLVVLLPEPVAAGRRFVLEIALEGELVHRLPDQRGHLLRDTTNWIPRHPDNRQQQFNLVFRTPERYRIASGGALVDEHVDDDTRITRWATAQPVRNLMAFHMGRFEIDELTDELTDAWTDELREAVEGTDDLPPIAVYADRHHRGFAPGNREKTMTDLVGAIRTFSDYFGPYPFESLLVTETQEYLGQAFPGLVLLSYTAFGQMHTHEQELFRSHEVAHQWWGAGVDWETYRDQWMSEGFAHYSGALYALDGLEEEDKFVDMLDAWRLDVLGQVNVGRTVGLRQFGLHPAMIRRSDGHESGPVVAGFRLQTIDTPFDYRVLVYEKGAFILHMLRMLLLDPETGDDDRFRRLMRGFVRDHVGGAASTQDFEAAVTEAFGEPMDWFFDQWVYGVHVPRYLPDLEVVPAADLADGPAAREIAAGEAPFVLTGTVRQEDAPPGFRMPVPVRMTFADRDPILRRIWVDGPEVTVEIPLPAEPEDVEFNWHHGVLAYSP